MFFPSCKANGLKWVEDSYLSVIRSFQFLTPKDVNKFDFWWCYFFQTTVWAILRFQRLYEIVEIKFCVMYFNSSLILRKGTRSKYTIINNKEVFRMWCVCMWMGRWCMWTQKCVGGFKRYGFHRFYLLQHYSSCECIE